MFGFHLEGITCDACLCLSEWSSLFSLWLEVAFFHPFYGWVALSWVCVPHLLYPFTWPSTLRFLLYLGYCTWCCHDFWHAVSFEHLVSEDPHPGVRWLGHLALCCWVFHGPSILFSRVDVLIYFPTHSVGGFPSLHSPSSIYCCRIFEVATLTGVKWYVIELLICISVMIRDAGHLFRCLTAAWMPSLEKCPLYLWTIFSVELFVFWYWAAWGVCLLWISPFANTSSPHSEHCLFLSFMVYHGAHDGRESEWTPGVGDGQGDLACCDSWGRKESDTTERLNWTAAQILLRLMRSHLFGFGFHYSKNESKANWLWFIAKRVLPVFLWRGL